MYEQIKNTLLLEALRSAQFKTNPFIYQRCIKQIKSYSKDI